MENKYYISGKSRFNEVEKYKLMQLGFTNFYELRSWDLGNGYNIEPRVFVNNVGCMATNFEIAFKDRFDPYIEDNDFFNTYQPIEENVDL